MVNETKVRLMTNAAMIKQKKVRENFTGSRFYGDDYVSFQVIKGVIGATIGFGILLGLWVLEHSEELMTQYTIQSLFELAGGIVILYLLVMLAAVLIGVFVYTARFWKSKESSREYLSNLKKLQRLYQQEENDQGV